MKIEQAFEQFMTDSDYTVFQNAVDLSTKTFWAGPGAGVELKPDGTYRVIELVNLGSYKPPGVILVIPCLSKEEYGKDVSERYYGTVREQLQGLFTEVLEMWNDEGKEKSQ